MRRVAIGEPGTASGRRVCEKFVVASVVHEAMESHIQYLKRDQPEGAAFHYWRRSWNVEASAGASSD